MRALVSTACLLALIGTLPAAAADVSAGSVTDTAVSIYRQPSRAEGALDLDNLNGFALISETRLVSLPVGESRLRFEGVADGIEPRSALINGLPESIIEKNRDAALLSPGALLAATLGQHVELRRTYRKSGKVERIVGTLESNAEQGVVFKSEQGVEGLRCAGVPETFSFDPVSGLYARPTLSVMVRTSKPISVPVTLTYLSRGFDWAATYTAQLSDDGKTLNLGGWVTLANSNAMSFEHARTQVIAGRLNRISSEVEPISLASPILARCWPQGSTSDRPDYSLALAAAAPARQMSRVQGVPVSDALMEVVVTGQRRSFLEAQQEDLGDLKLYRIPQATTVASRQLKQVRLLDREQIPVTGIYTATVLAFGYYGAEGDRNEPQSVRHVLRTLNNKVNKLGIPLPSGSVAVFAEARGAALLLDESDLRDLAVDEEVEISTGESSDVHLTVTTEGRTLDALRSQFITQVPGVSKLRTTFPVAARRADISNALDWDIDFELKLTMPVGGQLLRADHKLAATDGAPKFRLKVPAHSTQTVRFQVQVAKDTEVRDE